MLHLTTPHPSVPDNPVSPSVREAVRLRDDTAALTLGLQRGEEMVFREFHTRYFDRLYQFLLVVTRGRENEAQEALQETLVRVVRYVRRFAAEEVFWCWLKRVAWSVTKDLGRKQQRYRRLLERFAWRWQMIHPSPQVEPENNLAGLLEECLDQLEPGERQLVEGKYIRGASVQELAREHHLTEKAVESQLLRLRRFLRSALIHKLGSS